MTKRDLIEQLAAYPDDTVLLAFNGDDGEVLPVTGLLYTPPSGHDMTYIRPSLEFCTDKP